MSAAPQPTPAVEEKPLPVDPGRVRARAHYEAMLAQAKAEAIKQE